MTTDPTLADLITAHYGHVPPTEHADREPDTDRLSDREQERWGNGAAADEMWRDEPYEPYADERGRG